jgi:glycosyltransferase involved in cell wall biosynthesis
MPKVSVIIPCYNQGQYVDEAVDSILNQTFQDVELIVMNDGSTDEFTVEKLKHYNKPKTTVIHTSNQGLPKARNTGIRNGSGEYILALDADDYMGTTFLEKAVPVLDAQPEVGVVACGIQYFGTTQKRHMPKGGGVRTFLAQNDIGVPSLFRRVCWEETGGYDENLKQGYQDWNLWIDITKRGWLVHVIPEYLYFYRRTSDSMVTKSNLMRPGLVKQIVNNHREVFEQYVDDVIYEKEQKILLLKQARKKLQNSKSYKIGQWIAHPFRQLKKLVQSL